MLDNLFSDSTGLYFYSAVFQGNMALLALLGVFVVYRLQTHQQFVDRSIERAVKYVQSVFRSRFGSNVHFLPLNVEDLRDIVIYVPTQIKDADASIENEIQIIKETFKNDPQYCDFIALASGNKKLARIIITSFRKILLLVVAAILLSLLLLPFSSKIHEASAWIEALFFLSCIALNAIALLRAVVFIKYACVSTPTDFRDQL